MAKLLSGLTAIPWDKVLEIIATFGPLIMDCFKRQGRTKTRENLRNLGPFQKLRLRRGLRNLDLEDHFDSVVNTLKTASDEELDDLINEATGDNSPQGKTSKPK